MTRALSTSHQPAKRPLASRSPQWADLCITPRLVGGYSICSASEELPELALIVKRSAHPPTRAVHEELRAGCEVRVRTGGAAGVDLAREWTHRPAPHLVLIGGGIGVTPVLGIVAAATRAPCQDPRARISVLYSCRDACDFVGVAELAAAARSLPALHVRLFHTNASHAARCEVPGRDVHVFSVASRRMCERDVREVLTGSPTGCLAVAAADSAPLVLVCGPKGMQDAVLAWCRAAGVPEERLVYETWW